MCSIAALGKEQRYRWVREPHPADGTEVSLEFTFETVKKITGYTELAIEHPENFQIYLNRQLVEQRITGCLYDRGIKVLLPNGNAVLFQGLLWSAFPVRYGSVPAPPRPASVPTSVLPVCFS